MSWIESHTTMRNHKKLVALCHALGVNRAQAIGHLHMLWWWAIEHREDGDLTGLFDKDIALACDWEGEVKILIDALHSTGWLNDYHISDWDDYSFRLLEMRRTNKERQRKYRITRDVTRDVTGYVPPATVPNQTLPNHKEKKIHSRNFVAPTQIEVEDYFVNELKSDKDKALRFYQFYACKDWMVGKNRMKVWKLAAARSLAWTSNGAKSDASEIPESIRKYYKG